MKANEDLWQPSGGKFVDGELVIECDAKGAYPLGASLLLQRRRDCPAPPALDTYPLFAGKCPASKIPFPQYARSTVHWDCVCGWMDDIVSPWTSLVTALALLVYQVLAINVGRARVKYKVLPPQMTGDSNFERVLRVQQNTLEQLIFFLPALWLFSLYVSPLWGAIIGSVWILGRIAYAWGYYQAVEKRTIGFGISSISGMVLLLGSLFGIILSLAH